MALICYMMPYRTENGWEQAITLRVLAKLLQSLNYEKKRGHIEL